MHYNSFWNKFLLISILVQPQAIHYLLSCSFQPLPTCASERGKLSTIAIIVMDSSLYPTLDPGTTNSSSLFQNKVCIEGLGFSFSGCEKKRLPNKITLTAALGVTCCWVTSAPLQGGLQTAIGQQCHWTPGQSLVPAKPAFGETEHSQYKMQNAPSLSSTVLSPSCPLHDVLPSYEVITSGGPYATVVFTKLSEMQSILKNMSYEAFRIVEGTSHLIGNLPRAAQRQRVNWKHSANPFLILILTCCVIESL